MMIRGKISHSVDEKEISCQITTCVQVYYYCYHYCYCYYDDDEYDDEYDDDELYILYAYYYVFVIQNGRVAFCVQ